MSLPIRVFSSLSLFTDLFVPFLSFYGIGDALMIGGGRRGKYTDKSPEEIREAKNKLRRDNRKNRSQQKADEEKEEDRARKKTPRNKENDRMYALCC